MWHPNNKKKLMLPIMLEFSGNIKHVISTKVQKDSTQVNIHSQAGLTWLPTSLGKALAPLEVPSTAGPEQHYNFGP